MSAGKGKGASSDKDAGAAKAQALRTMAQTYADLGLSMIPVKAGSKVPDLSKWEQYQKRRPKDEELDGWFTRTRNIGIVCGAVSGGLVVLDFDDPRAFRYTYLDRKELASQTLVAETGKGVHVYARLKGGGTPKGRTYRRTGKGLTWLPLDIKGEGGYVVAPPSVHPSGKPYRFLGEASDIMEVSEPSLREKLDQRAEEWPFVEAVLDAWKEGNRHNLALGLAKILRYQRRFSEDRVEAVVRRLCVAAEDSEVEDRIHAVRDTFTKGAEGTAAQSWLGEGLYATLQELMPKPASRRKGRRAAAGEEDIRYETYLELPDGRIVEEIAGLDGEQFVVYDPKTDTLVIVPEVEVAGTKVRPLPIPKMLRDKLTLADGVEEYGSTEALLKEMESLGLEVFDPMKEKPLFNMWIRVGLSSWIVDPLFAGYVEKFASICRTTGPSESGKGRLLTVSRFLFYRPLYFLKTVRVPSLFRTMEPWHGTLILDEADVSKSSESAEFIQYLNARAVDSVIPRYDAESNEMRFFGSFGHTIVATRKPYSDDGVNSRSIFLSAEATTRNDIDLHPSPEWLERARILHNKLLLWRLHRIGEIRAKELKVPTRLDIEGVRSFRVREAFLVMAALEKKEPGLLKDMAEVAKEVERRLIVERAASPSGLILNVVYGCLQDEHYSVEKDGVAYRLVREHQMQKEGDKQIVGKEPLTLGNVVESLGKTFSSMEIARYWRGLGQATKARDRIEERRYSGIILIKDPDRLDREFQKFVVDALSISGRFPKCPPPTPLEDFGGKSPIDMCAAGTGGTGGTNQASEGGFVPPVRAVPPGSLSIGTSPRIFPAATEEISADRAEGPAGKEERFKRGIRDLVVLEHLRSPEKPLEEMAARIADELRKHEHDVDLEQVMAEVRDVIKRAAEDHSDEGGPPS